MTDASGRTGGFVLGTASGGRNRSAPGIVWLDRLSLVEGRRAHPAYGPTAAAGRATSGSGGAATVGTTVEMPAGYLLIDVRVGYATAAGAWAAEVRVADLSAHRKSALVLLERRDGGGGDQGSPGGDPATVFVDARPNPPGERTFLCVEAAVADGVDGVAVRGLSVDLVRA